MHQEKNLILDKSQVRQKIRRISYEIFEHNFLEEEVVFAGIYDKGYFLAGMIADELASISNISPKLVRVDLDKFSPLQSEVKLDCSVDELVGKPIVLVDDVLNTGRTLAFSLKPFLNMEVKRIEIAVLVNRGHAQYPVSSKYVGYELSTTINEHVEVQLEADLMNVYLI
ncbi:MAG: phosphoribosyltransferase family protein [Bacteroidota bacterium]